MEITFSLLRSKEVINTYDGKRLGRFIDISIEKETGRVLGFVVPGFKKLFRKTDDLFIPLNLVRKIGEDVILVRLAPLDEPQTKKEEKDESMRAYEGRYVRVPKRER